MVPSTGALAHNDGVFVGEVTCESSLSQPPVIQNSQALVNVKYEGHVLTVVKF